MEFFGNFDAVSFEISRVLRWEFQDRVCGSIAGVNRQNMHQNFIFGTSLDSLYTGKRKGPRRRTLERICSASSVRNEMNGEQSGVESFGNVIQKMRNTK